MRIWQIEEAIYMIDGLFRSKVYDMIYCNLGFIWNVDMLYLCKSYYAF